MTPLVAVHPVEPDSKPGLVSFWPVLVQPLPPPEPDTVQLNVALPEAPVLSLAVTVTSRCRRSSACRRSARTRR